MAWIVSIRKGEAARQRTDTMATPFFFMRNIKVNHLNHSQYNKIPCNFLWERKSYLLLFLNSLFDKPIVGSSSKSFSSKSNLAMDVPDQELIFRYWSVVSFFNRRSRRRRPSWKRGETKKSWHWQIYFETFLFETLLDIKSSQTGKRLLVMESIRNGDNIEHQQSALRTSGSQRN